MAELLGEHGFPCHATAVAKIEAGERVLSAEELVAYADAFGISADRLTNRRSRPAADRDFVRRRLQGAIDDAARTVRVGVGAVGEALAEVADIDDGTDADVIADIRAKCDQLSADASALAQAGGVIAQRRGTRRRVVRVQYEDGDA
jgi:hypothetical protein